MKRFQIEAGIGFLALCALKLVAATHYVDWNSTNSVAPYTNWNTAAANIQDAVDAAANGDLVLVTNGVYATGGRRWFDSGTNRVTLTNAVTLESVNGPAVTLIVGNQVAGSGPVLTNTARCVGMGNNAILSGFTLTNGEAGWGNYPNGGGVANLVGGTSTVTNCVLIGNVSPTSSYEGGGADRVTLINCKIIGNHAGYGGGASRCPLINCTVVSNTASSSGGGVYLGIPLVNCTIVGNSSSGSGGGVGDSAHMYNCIVYYNTAPSGSNYTGSKMDHCCTVPILDPYANSFTNPPLFQDMAAGDFHLQSNSPCINFGNNGYVTVTDDLDGNPRIAGGTVDVGAYEYQTPSSVLSYAWLQQYGLPTDGSADYANPDRDGLNNYQEWIAGTDPTNASSTLWMFSPTNGTTGLVLSWQSVSGKSYWIQRATDLSAQAPFSTIVSNLYIYSSTGTYTDTTATNAGPYFYRVAVQP